MNSRKLWQRRRKSMLIVAPASASTWAVACSRRLIPGALFRTRAAAIDYASALANAAGLSRTHVKVLGGA
ncbi:MAG TPA: hypothetical protein VFG44_04495 [Burkholderiales bacterium]|jgi:hypothetical protein|nr:hypothetical protein [Burkholderiales bacterium]